MICVGGITGDPPAPLLELELDAPELELDAPDPELDELELAIIPLDPLELAIIPLELLVAVPSPPAPPSPVGTVLSPVAHATASTEKAIAPHTASDEAT